MFLKSLNICANECCHPAFAVLVELDDAGRGGQLTRREDPLDLDEP